MYSGYDLANVTGFDCETLLAGVEKSGKDIIIYGAGIQSRTIIQILDYIRSKNLKIRLIDSNRRKVGELFQGKIIEDVSILEELNKNDCIVLIGSCFPGQILKALGGRAPAYSILPIYEEYKYLLSEIDLNSNDLQYKRSVNDVEREMLLYDTEFSNLVCSLDNNSLSLKSIDAVVTEGCSLKCKDCSNLMQYYHRPKNAHLEMLIESTRNILSCIDEVFEWRILGGEPFLFKQLGSYLDYLSTERKIRKVVIYTNGTIKPKHKTLEGIKACDAIVDISNYGELSRNLSGLTDLLKEHDISHAVKDPRWTDSGKITSKQNLQENQLENRFFNCCTRDVLTLLHGYVYRCPFSANLMNLSDGFIDETDRVYVGNKAAVNTRERLSELYKGKRFLSACDNCNGRDYTTPFVATAIQTRQVLKIPVHAIS